MSRTIDLEQIQSLDIKPGDTVIITVAAHYTSETRRSVGARVAKMFPRNKVIVISDGVKIDVIKRVVKT